MIREIDFDTIKNIWQEYLWPGRQIILPMSNMRYKDTPYLEISKKYTPTFFAYYIDNMIAGVNSGHCSSRFHYRSRGLFVFPEHRSNGVGTKLLEHACKLGKNHNMVYCWSLPRKSALNTYLHAGFEQTSGFAPTETSDQNCYVRIDV